jgi:hypothetical protein
VTDRAEVLVHEFLVLGCIAMALGMSNWKVFQLNEIDSKPLTSMSSAEPLHTNPNSALLQTQQSKVFLKQDYNNDTHCSNFR